jgi:hypothetical protein
VLAHLRELVHQVPTWPIPRFLLKHGRAFAPGSGPLPSGVRYSRARKNCYGDATRLMLDRDGFVYVECFGLLGGAPLQHAWWVDARQGVVDVSWNPARVGHVREYFGIPFKRAFVCAVISRAGHYGGVLDAAVDAPPRDWLAT